MPRPRPPDGRRDEPGPAGPCPGRCAGRAGSPAATGRCPPRQRGRPARPPPAGRPSGMAAAGQLIGCIRCRIRRCRPCRRVHPGVAPHPGEQFHAADVGGHWPHRQQRAGNARVEPVADVRGDRGADPGQQHDPGQHRHVAALPGGDQHGRRRGGDQPVTGQRQQRRRGDGLPVVTGEGVDVRVGVAAGEEPYSQHDPGGYPPGGGVVRGHGHMSVPVNSGP